MADINTGPQPIAVSGNTAGIPLSAIDRQPAPVPVTTTPTIIPDSAIDRSAGAAPSPYSSGVTQSRTSVTVAATVTPAGGGVIPAPAGALPIAVADEGTTLTTAVRSFNFVGDGVVAVANTQNNGVTVTITGGNVISNYSNANVAAYLPVNTSNVRGNYFIGNGSQLTGIVAVSSYANSNVAAYLASGADSSNIVTTGNVQGSYILGNGSQLTGIVTSSYTNANVAAYLPTYTGNLASLTGNVTTTANVTGGKIISNEGSLTNLDSLNFIVENISALVGNNGVNIGAGGYNNLVVLPTDVLIQNVPLTVTGNISGNYILGNGSQLTGLGATYANANVAAFLASGADLSNIITSANVSGSYILGNGSQLTGLAAPYGNADVAANLTAFANNPILTTGNIGAGNINVTTATGNLVLGRASATGSPGINSTSSVTVVSDRFGTPKEWTFGTDGSFTGLGNISGGNLITAAVVNSGNIIIEAGTDIHLRGGDKISAAGQNGGNINIDAGDGGADNGTNAGAGGSIEISGGPGGTVAAGTPGTGGQILVGGGMGSGSNVTNAVAAGVGGQITVVGGDGGTANTSPLSSAGGNVEIYGGTGSRSQANAVTGAAGHVNIYGGNWGSTANSGNITVNTYGSTTQHQWIFANNGNLTVPGSIILPANSLLTSVSASPAPSINGFDTISALTFSATGNITGGNINATGTTQLAVYANTIVRDSAISSPQPGMMIYVTGTGMQVRGATSWNTIAGSGT